MAFQSVLPPTTVRPKSQALLVPELLNFTQALTGNFSLSTVLLVGATFQALLTLLIPSYYTLLPTLLVLGSRLTYTLLITYHIIPNPYLKDSLLHRTSAQVPDKTGQFSSNGASEGVVCFHLGAKLNHPLGIFSPNAKGLGDRFNAMIRELDANKATNGFLGGSNWTSFDERGATETSFISYWRSIEDIHSFGYGETHRKAWEWWNKLTKEESQHIGINHEIFAAGPGQWEAVYLNQQPSLLGATSYLRKGDKEMGGMVGDTWVGGLVDASKGKLKGSAGRLGWQPERLYEKKGYQPTEEVYAKA